MTDSDHSQAVTDYYVLRIYRRGLHKDGKQRGLVGVIEDTAGRQKVFRSFDELWRMLVGDARQRHPEP